MTEAPYLTLPTDALVLGRRAAPGWTAHARVRVCRCGAGAEAALEQAEELRRVLAQPEEKRGRAGEGAGRRPECKTSGSGKTPSSCCGWQASGAWWTGWAARRWTSPPRPSAGDWSPAART